MSNRKGNFLEYIMLSYYTKKVIDSARRIIHELIRHRKIKAIKLLSGKLSIESNLDNLKKTELKKLRKLNN